MWQTTRMSRSKPHTINQNEGIPRGCALPSPLPTTAGCLHACPLDSRACLHTSRFSCFTPRPSPTSHLFSSSVLKPLLCCSFPRVCPFLLLSGVLCLFFFLSVCSFYCFLFIQDLLNLRYTSFVFLFHFVSHSLYLFLCLAIALCHYFSLFLFSRSLSIQGLA